MIDISGRYDRDYNTKVINKGLFIENVENKNVSKSITNTRQTLIMKSIIIQMKQLMACLQMIIYN